jgi:hypothetical protein
LKACDVGKKKRGSGGTAVGMTDGDTAGSATANRQVQGRGIMREIESDDWTRRSDIGHWWCFTCSRTNLLMLFVPSTYWDRLLAAPYKTEWLHRYGQKLTTRDRNIDNLEIELVYQTRRPAHRLDLGVAGPAVIPSQAGPHANQTLPRSVVVTCRRVAKMEQAQCSPSGKIDSPSSSANPLGWRGHPWTLVAAGAWRRKQRRQPNIEVGRRRKNKRMKRSCDRAAV